MKLKRIALGAIIGISFWGCKKNSSEESAEQRALQDDTYAATAIISVEGMANELEFIARQAPLADQSASFLSCANIEKQNVSEGQKIEITFNSNIACSDKTYRSGKLSLMYYTNGAITVTPQNYAIESTLINGVFTFQNMTGSQNNYMALDVPDGKFTLSTGAYIKFSISRESAVKAGSSTADLSDDVIEIKNAQYDLNVFNLFTNTLIQGSTNVPYNLKYSCSDKFRPRTGKILYHRMGADSRYIDFGNGTCEAVPVLSEVIK